MRVPDLAVFWFVLSAWAFATGVDVSTTVMMTVAAALVLVPSTAVNVKQSSSPGAEVAPDGSVRFLLIKRAQLEQKRPGRPVFAHQPRDHFLHLGGVGKLLPFEDAAKHINAILVDQLGQLQIAPGLLVHRGHRIMQFGGERQRHGDRLALRAGKILEILLGEPVKQPLHFTRQQDQSIPSAVHREVVAA